MFSKIRADLSKVNDYWAIIVITISLVISVINSINSPLLKSDLNDLIANAIHKQNSISNNVLRFEELRAILPAHSTVGYLNSSLINNGNIDGAAYFQAQYALAPILVSDIVSGTKITYPLVVGDFNAPVNLVELSSRLHLEIVRDFNNGIILFRNTLVTQ